MPYDNRCPLCGAFLDPCERCDCAKVDKEKAGDLEPIQATPSQEEKEAAS